MPKQSSTNPEGGPEAVDPAVKVAAGSRPKFNICQVVVNQHAAVFETTVRALRGALIDLGHTCSVMQNAFDRGAINIMLGATVVAARNDDWVATVRDQPFVLYQFEQIKAEVGFLAIFPGYRTLMESAVHILEYSPAGLDYLSKSAAGDKTSLLQPSFHRSLETFRPAKGQDIDVLFYGSLCARRSAVLDQLERHGLRTGKIFGYYGDELIAYLRRAKIIINIHQFDEMNVLETVRLSHLLANRCFVISETADHNPYGAGVVYAAHDRLVDTCLAYLGDRAHERDAVAAEGYLAVRRSDLVTDLRAIIPRLPIERLVSQKPN